MQRQHVCLTADCFNIIYVFYHLIDPTNNPRNTTPHAFTQHDFKAVPKQFLKKLFPKSCNIYIYVASEGVLPSGATKYIFPLGYISKLTSENFFKISRIQYFKIAFSI